MATRVELFPYDQSWEQAFSELADDMHKLIGASIRAIDHVGSTAVPGMPAKPIIDVDITLASLADIPAASAVLTASGYEPRGNRYDDDVWAFMKHDRKPKQRIYLCPPENETHRRRLIFRDYLRAHKDVAAAYAALKQQLAAKFPNDGDRYTAEKRDFIETVVARARYA